MALSLTGPSQFFMTPDLQCFISCFAPHPSEVGVFVACIFDIYTLSTTIEVRNFNKTDKKTVSCQISLPGYPRITHCSFCPRGRFLVFSFRSDPRVLVYQFDREQLLFYREHAFPIAGLCWNFSSSGRVLAALSNAQEVTLWDIETMKISSRDFRLPHELESCFFFPRSDNQLVLTHLGCSLVNLDDESERSLELLPRSSAQPVNPQQTHGMLKRFQETVVNAIVAAKNALEDVFSQPSRIVACAVDPYGRSIAVGKDNGHLEMWNLATQRCTASSRAGDDDSVCFLEFSPRGLLLLVLTKSSGCFVLNAFTLVYQFSVNFLKGPPIASAQFNGSGALQVFVPLAGGVDMFKLPPIIKRCILVFVAAHRRRRQRCLPPELWEWLHDEFLLP